jgi:hypothetical protein
MTPPTSLMARSPTLPSVPEPETTIPTGVTSAWARERKNWSIGERRSSGSWRDSGVRVVPSTRRVRPGAVTYTWFGSMAVGSVTCRTGMAVWACSTSAS